ncbi:hypothetical protein TNCV_4654071 [Trichonephila clavipes]|nr:hypothetical protein TNCV_4654071 [Trichonephila clavipes]
MLRHGAAIIKARRGPTRYWVGIANLEALQCILGTIISISVSDGLLDFTVQEQNLAKQRQTMVKLFLTGSKSDNVMKSERDYLPISETHWTDFNIL